ncbi:methanol O-anthraniloyltransferase [Olea europaea subsp. europaea]|uniref:Methanol O-anthraniloyltransferase n=1 Tax=Olea europaea subsp. europaea TaxID=158383 RepID=A0A8S0PE87_OLEEU|nr:methanol O-anthraniloyltransferase [Olea europaea subsp. europaea]
MAFSSTFAFSVQRCKPELVVPVKPTPREIKKLSNIDDQEGFRFQIPIVFFYKNNPSMKGINPVEVIREGLAKMLVYYCPFAGRIMEGDNRKRMVDCNGEGVFFVEVDACIMLEQLGDNILPPCPLMEEFLHDVPGTGGIIGCPLLLIQVTRFICGGFAWGIRFNHTMADVYEMMQFLNSISELIKAISGLAIALDGASGGVVWTVTVS